MNKTTIDKTAADVYYCDVQRIDTAKLEQQLRIGSVELCRAVLTDLLQQAGYFEVKSLLMQLYVAMDVYVTARSFTKTIGIRNEEFVALYGSIDDIESHMTTPEATVDFFTEMLEQCIRWRVAHSRESSSDAVRAAVEYINNNYMDDTLSLGATASSVNLSPTYFSALFKKETGKNFSDYLASVRIEKAKSLLCCTSKRISEISDAVGYSDYRYFGQIFKRMTGKTPREFQQERNRG